MATRANHLTQYYQNEDPYGYCPTCSAVHDLKTIGLRCNRGDLPPFVGGYCTGIILKGGAPQRQVLARDITKTA